MSIDSRHQSLNSNDSQESIKILVIFTMIFHFCKYFWAPENSGKCHYLLLLWLYAISSCHYFVKPFKLKVLVSTSITSSMFHLKFMVVVQRNKIIMNLPIFWSWLGWWFLGSDVWENIVLTYTVKILWWRIILCHNIPLFLIIAFVMISPLLLFLSNNYMQVVHELLTVMVASSLVSCCATSLQPLHFF